MLLAACSILAACGNFGITTEANTAPLRYNNISSVRYLEETQYDNEVDYLSTLDDVLEWKHAELKHYLEGDHAAKVAAAKARRASHKRVYGGTMGNGHCGPAYHLPPCSVMMRESGGNINAYNPTGCNEGNGHVGCKGKWQCSYSTCSGTGSEEEQDAEARALWADGKGCQHWDACG